MINGLRIRNSVRALDGLRTPYPQVYRASAWRWCKRRTPTAIGVDGARTVECERARRTVDAAGREPLLRGGVGGQQPESAHERCERPLEAAVLAGGGE